MTIKQLIKKHEGYRSRLYQDTCGNWTIGYGYNIGARGLPHDILEELLERDIVRVWRELESRLPWFRSIPEPWQVVLMDMTYNMGITKLMQFTRMLAAMKHGDTNQVITEVLNSEWSKQVGKERVKDLHTLVEEGGELSANTTRNSSQDKKEKGS